MSSASLGCWRQSQPLLVCDKIPRGTSKGDARLCDVASSSLGQPGFDALPASHVREAVAPDTTQPHVSPSFLFLDRDFKIFTPPFFFSLEVQSFRIAISCSKWVENGHGPLRTHSSCSRPELLLPLLQ